MSNTLSRDQKLELVLLLEEKRKRQERRKCAEDCGYFIEKYVRIEDRDEALRDKEGEAGISIPFTLWEGQKGVLKDFLTSRLLILLKARQLGLTWLVLAYAVWRMIFFPGYQVVALSKKETPDAKELVRRVKFIFSALPDWMIKEKKKGAESLVWEATALSVTVSHPGKEPSVLISMSSSPDAGRSFTANLVLLDEWAYQQWAEDIYTAAYPTINRPSGGQVIGLSTAARLTFFETVWKDAVKGKSKFKAIFLPWWTDPRRNQEWYEETKRNLPRSYMQEYPSTAEEAFSAGIDTAFPEFSEDIHVCDDFRPPKHWRRWRSVDNGYSDPFAWYWYAVSEDGQVFVYREYTRDFEDGQILYSDQARTVKELSSYIEIEEGEEVETMEKIGFTVAGHDAWFSHHRDMSGKTLIDYYGDGGLTGFIKAITDRRFRKDTIHEYLKPYLDKNTGEMTAKVQICRSCRKLIETLPQLLKDEKDAEKVAECAIDHWFDSFGYGLNAWHVKQSKPISKPKNAVQEYKDKMARQSMRKRKGIL
jgi:hypothetical protein